MRKSRLNPLLTDWLTSPEGLAANLRQIRVAAQLSGSQLAKDLGWAPSKVSRAEHGKTVLTAAEVEAWAERCGATPATRRLLDRLQAEAITRQLELRGQVDQGHRQRSFADLHRAASVIIEYGVYLVPGPLQVEPYAAAVLHSWSKIIDTDPATVAVGAVERASRAALLHDPGKHHRFLLAESALQWCYGGREVMAAQLDRLAAIAELPSVDLRLIPAGPVDVPIGTGFVAFDDLVIGETWSGIWEDSMATRFSTIVDLLTVSAASPSDSLAILRAASEAAG